MTAAIAAASAAPAANPASAKTPGIAENFQAFLTLLTTQLRNQSPLDPMDTNQFTQQLVAFAGVEQQIRTNDTLTGLVAATTTGTTASALALVGAEVTADGSLATLGANGATWRVSAPARGEANFTVRDASGNVVAAFARGLAAGAQDIAWDGTGADGTRLPAGDYTLSATFRDSSGRAGDIDMTLTGTVSRVSLREGTPWLALGGVELPLSRVTAVSRPASG
jgi:flagellar basal-body rod modification protein FlgD